MRNDQYNSIRSMKSASEIVKVRKVLERIEDKLTKAIKILENGK
tara:strand:+ start:412 stop:543 length:132 start_codon:yes stop_codon:yes gene_type:complete